MDKPTEAAAMQTMASRGLRGFLNKMVAGGTG
jgi:hypothetical protein